MLFGGDYLSSKKNERLLIQAVKSIIDDHTEQAQKLLNYTINKQWIDQTQDIIDIMSKSDEHFPNVMIIVADSIDNIKVLLGFKSFYGYMNDSIQRVKKNCIVETTQQEREYLWDVFDSGNQEIRFNAHDGNCGLYYPYIKGSQKIVLHFSNSTWPAFLSAGKPGSFIQIVIPPCDQT